MALALWASLVPQVAYPSASSGEPAGDVLIAWPGWAVQQDLGALDGTVGRFQIWISADPGGDRMTVHASLVDASSGEVLRQTSIRVEPAYVPAPRTFDFPAYVVPEGQRLHLQLQVTDLQHDYVIYRLTDSSPGLSNLMLNGVPDAGSGPLAFSHLDTGSGLRAALLGEPASRLRLALAVIFSGLVVLAHPRIAAGLRRIGTVVRRSTGRLLAWSRRLAGPRAAIAGDTSPTVIGRVFAIPWYPWPIASVPILHFLASNPLHFSPRDAVVPLGVTLVAVTVSMIGLWLILRDWYRSAAVTAAVAVVFFAYGHVERVLDHRIEEHILFAGAVVLAASAVAVAVRSGGLAARLSQPLNLAITLLLAFQLWGPIVETAASIARPSVSHATVTDDLTAHLFPDGLPAAGSHRPDIYYIILDMYARHDVLGDFDNAEFLGELESRGFYVAREATSNYKSSMQSIASSLNLAYVDNLGQRSPVTDQDTLDVTHNHALGHILKSIGYTYVHLESGNILTDIAPLADVFVSFTPAGAVASGSKENRHLSASLNGPKTGEFLRELIGTTALRPIIGQHLPAHRYQPYDWWHPQRALQTFEFLTNAIDADSPKFVFAHILKPHDPYTFDRYGNTVPGVSVWDTFRDDHDPSVPDAFVGQIIYINSLILEMIDGILENSIEEPIIVISGDHARDQNRRHPIMAAFHLPYGRNDGLYPSISSVNHFRYILDYYFDFGIGLTEDVIIHN
ncbi:MAG: hypothetical protein OXG65_01100 [Chloroflexi bacterium]|nr:hypothetical protein [Chloroflexota bacterium]